MITKSLRLNLKLVYQLIQRMMIWPSKCRPLKSASTGANRSVGGTIWPFRTLDFSFATSPTPEPVVHVQNGKDVAPLNWNSHDGYPGIGNGCGAGRKAFGRP